MKLSMLFLPAILAFPLLAQAPSQSVDPWKALGFLQGTWEAKANGQSGAQAQGTYMFQMELKNHVLARHSQYAGCRGPADFDCNHGDLLYVYQESPGQPLKALYLDNEGHVIYYSVSTPTATSAEFVSDPSQSGPQFRLLYELQGSAMSGKFQMRMAGQSEWKSYLEWSGSKRM